MTKTMITLFVVLLTLAVLTDPAHAQRSEGPLEARELYTLSQGDLSARRFGRALARVEKAQRLLGGTNVRLELARAEALAGLQRWRALDESLARLDALLPPGVTFAVVERLREDRARARAYVAREDGTIAAARAKDPGKARKLVAARIARENYRRYLERYPNGAYTGEARARASALAKMIARLELERRIDARFATLERSYRRVRQNPSGSFSFSSVRDEHEAFLREFRNTRHDTVVRQRVAELDGLYADARYRELTAESQLANRRADELRGQGSGHVLAGLGLTLGAVASGVLGGYLLAAQPLSDGGDAVLEYPLAGGLFGLAIFTLVSPVPEVFGEAGDLFGDAARQRRIARQRRNEASSFLRGTR